MGLRWGMPLRAWLRTITPDDKGRRLGLQCLQPPWGLPGHSEQVSSRSPSLPNALPPCGLPKHSGFAGSAQGGGYN